MIREMAINPYNYQLCDLFMDKVQWTRVAKDLLDLDQL